MWEKLKAWLTDFFEDAEADIVALVTAEVQYAKETFEPELVVAAQLGYNAAEQSSFKGLDKLNLAATTAKGYLIGQGIEFSFGAIVTACQAVWKQQQLNDAADAAQSNQDQNPPSETVTQEQEKAQAAVNSAAAVASAVSSSN